MFSEYNTSNPLPTDYFSQVFRNLRMIKLMYQERYVLDHHMNLTDLEETEGHNRATIYGVNRNMYVQDSPYPLNPLTGMGEIPSGSGIVFIKSDNRGLYFSKIHLTAITEVRIC